MRKASHFRSVCLTLKCIVLTGEGVFYCPQIYTSLCKLFHSVKHTQEYKYSREDYNQVIELVMLSAVL